VEQERIQMIITFTDTVGVPEEFNPKPATASVPDWYKNIESYMNGAKRPTGEGNTSATIKRCMPVFDAITGGYILYSYADVFVSQKPLQTQKQVSLTVKLCRGMNGPLIRLSLFTQ